MECSLPTQAAIQMLINIISADEKAVGDGGHKGMSDWWQGFYD
jgi:hypothetical protein